MLKNKKGNYYLTCKGIVYYSYIDEEIFFQWFAKIRCIESFEEARDELYLHLIPGELDYEGMHELIALFYRYKINMHQLLALMNDTNKAAIEPWIKRILRTKRVVYKTKDESLEE